MKQYVKTIDAEQFNGDIESLQKFVGEENEVVQVSEDKVTLTTKTDKWNVVLSDYVAKGYYGLLVFKEERFLKEFDEVVIKNVFPVKEAKEQLKKLKPVK